MKIKSKQIRKGTKKKGLEQKIIEDIGGGKRENKVGKG